MSMCPNCGAEFETDTPAFEHIRRYHQPIIAKAKCCGVAIHMVPVEYINLGMSDAVADDWGNPCKPAHYPEHPFCEKRLDG